MSKLYVEPYDKSYLGLACLTPQSEQNKIVLCKLERHTGMLWWKKVEKMDVWGVTGIVHRSCILEVDYWCILKFFDYDDKDKAYQFLKDMLGDEDE